MAWVRSAMLRNRFINTAVIGQPLQGMFSTLELEWESHRWTVSTITRLDQEEHGIFTGLGSVCVYSNSV